MPLALIAVLLAPLALAPLWSARLEHEALLEERRQIAFDNGAIVLGQTVRVALRALEAVETTLQAIDVGHHLLHACALVEPDCKVADVAAEQLMRLTHRAAETAFRAAMAAAPAIASVELRDALGRGRVERPPLRMRTGYCAVCRMPVRWNLTLGDGAVVETGRPARRRVVRWSRSGTWNYRVVWKEAAGAFSSR